MMVEVITGTLKGQYRKGVIDVSKKKHRRRKCKKNKRRQYDHFSCNRHHFLWPKARWSARWAQKLRMHEYCNVAIPQHTLHKEIHCKMTDIPVARETNCKAVYEALETEMANYTISLLDEPQTRLKWLIEHFSECEPDTAAALKHELRIVLDYAEREFLLKLP